MIRVHRILWQCQFYFNSWKSQIHLYDLITYDALYPQTLDIELKNLTGKQKGGKSLQKQQRRGSSSKTDRHVIDVVRAEQTVLQILKQQKTLWHNVNIQYGEEQNICSVKACVMLVISHIMTYSWQVTWRNDLHTCTALYGFLNLPCFAECALAWVLTWNTTWRSVNNSEWPRNLTVSLNYYYYFLFIYFFFTYKWL